MLLKSDFESHDSFLAYLNDYLIDYYEKYLKHHYIYPQPIPQRNSNGLELHFDHIGNFVQKQPKEASLSLEDIKRKYWKKIMQAMSYYTLNNDEGKLEKLSYWISFLCGRASQEGMEKVWHFHLSPHLTITVQIKEASYCQSDLGSKTWPSSILFSKLFTNGALSIDAFRNQRVLELGSGTGLFTLFLCQLLKLNHVTVEEIWMTDFEDNLLQLMKQNQLRNQLKDFPLRIAKLDWFQFLESDDVIEMNHMKKRFDRMIATDVIYNSKHAQALPRVFDSFLSDDGLIQILLPLRPQYTAEVAEFEQEMLHIGFSLQSSLELWDQLDGSADHETDYETDFMCRSGLWFRYYKYKRE